MQTTNTKSATLSINDLRKSVPAAFAKAPAPTVSEKYQFIDSHAVIERLLKEGFVAVSASQSKPRTEDKIGFTRHTIRFRKTNAKLIVGEVFPEVGFINGHGGGTRFSMYGGLYRTVCSNGLVVATGYGNSVTTRHIGDIDELIEAGFKVADNMGKMTGKVELLRGIKLPKDWALPFAGNAANIVYGPDHQFTKEPASLLVPRRTDDEGDSLWQAFNVVQENLTKGGVQYLSAHGRNVKTKGLSEVKRDIEVNAALWDLMEHFASELSPEYRDFAAADMLS